MSQKTQSENLGELFLNEFVLRIIKSVRLNLNLPQEQPNFEKELEHVLEPQFSKEESELMPSLKQNIPEKTKEIQQPKHLPQKPVQQIAPRPQIQKIQLRPMPQKPVQQIKTEIPKPLPPVMIQPAAPSPISIQSSIPALDKINPLLLDPAVVSIECTGPDKPVLVNLRGRIQASKILLTKENIEEIMQEFSKRTKIPLVSGVFKAAFENYIITAVVSDYVGTRFTIEKKSPFMQNS